MYMWGQCYTASNNIHHNFPPMMSDGRSYTSWDAASIVNGLIKDNSKLKTNWDYRNYLTDNSHKIDKSDKLVSCFMTENLEDDGMFIKSNPPYLYSNMKDVSRPNGYQSSDLKDEYLSRYDLQSRRNTPILSQEQMLKAGFKTPN
jgi:hypothetical protein